MEPDRTTPPPNRTPEPGGGPGERPLAPPLVGGGAPPPLPPEPAARPSGGRQFLAFVVSVCIGVFLADAVVSLLDNALALVFGSHALSGLAGLVFSLALLLAAVVYLLMGVTPMLPKRLLLPLTLFNPVAGLLFIPVVIYFYGRMLEISLLISVGQVLLGLGVLYGCRRGGKPGWPLFPAERLKARGFSWVNLFGFVGVNVVVVVPAVAAYLGLCAGLAVGHFSDGFLLLRPGGFSVRARTYVRQDGKRIQLVPMAHIGDASFYHKLAQSFPSNSVILMEGVTDRRQLLTNHITYHRMATSLGLAEQQKEFEPTQGEIVDADIDVEEFTPETIGFLNLVMLVHARGVTPQNLLLLLSYSPSPRFEERLFADLLDKRNRHLLGEIQSRLPTSEALVVPWGVAHMPGLAHELEREGFRLADTKEYRVMRFGGHGRGGG